MFSYTCLGCGQKVKLEKDAQFGKVCPRCKTPEGQNAPVPIANGGPKQIIQIYTVYNTGGRVMQTFEKDAKALARVGWRVETQTAGGNVMASFKVQPSTLSVTYTRDA
jgi:hypothetical protein